MTAWQLNWRGWSSIITMSHAYLPSSGPICLSNTTINPAQTQPRHSSGHHSNFLNPKGRITLMGLLQYCLTYRVWRSESRTIWTIVMWTIQPVRVFTVCYCFGRRDTKTHGGRGHLSTWAVPSWISVTVWLTATTFNGLKAFVLRALSQAWPVMVSLHGKGDGEGVKFCQRVPWCFEPSVSLDFKHLFVPVLQMPIGHERHKRSWHRLLMWSVVLVRDDL